MLNPEIDLDQLMVEWLSLPTSLYVGNHTNVRMLIETDYSVMEQLSGPSQNVRTLKALIRPKVKGFPDLIVVRQDAWQRFECFTTDGKVPEKPIIGYWSSASVCQRHYDKVLQSADLGLEQQT